VAFQICSLTDGRDFRAGPNLTPDQHIYRAANPDWIPPPRGGRGGRRGQGERGGRGGRGRGGRSPPPPQPPQPPQPPATISKFRVRRRHHNGRDYWSPYDLLWLFLSSMGPAPNGATKRNFYLPITAVYGRWCRQIAGSHPRNGVCDSPQMFQCTWCIPSSDSSQPTRFSLGSSLAGYDWTPELTGTWKTVLRHERFALVDRSPLQEAGYNFDNSPMIEEFGPTSTRFGNCAETYPFLDLLMYVLCSFLYRIHC
jgi:hypothetical protein